MRPGVSGVACTSTGTSRPAMRRVSATPRSSPKLGSVTMTPSIESRCFLNRSAQSAASARVSTAPNLVSSGPGATAWYPAFSMAASISERPLWARWPGKNPRFPTITPKVIIFPSLV